MQLELSEEVDQEYGELLREVITDDETLRAAAELLQVLENKNNFGPIAANRSSKTAENSVHEGIKSGDQRAKKSAVMEQKVLAKTRTLHLHLIHQEM